MNKKLTVGIIFGGRSVEHKISMLSASNIVDNIDKERFEIKLIGISQKGKWFYFHEFGQDWEQGELLNLRLNMTRNPFFLEKTGESIGSLDIMFPILHGNDGEDGAIQGFLKTFDIPFVGSGVLGSSVSMDKVVSKKILMQEGIPVSRYLSFLVEEKEDIDFHSVKEELGLPLIIKPVASGSSVGVSKVTDEKGFYQALEDTFQYDNHVIVEEYVEGREIECAVMGNIHPDPSLPGEIIVSDEYGFYSFDAKYVDESGAKLEIPAKLDEATVMKVQKLAVRAYKALCCEDFSRVDMFLKPDGELILLEINTIPGFTSISMFSKLRSLKGINNTELISSLIDGALKKSEREQRIRRDFDSAL
ncbi:D-alanine--D-alanine ligase family protein [Bacteroidota bacterium]